MSCCRTKEFLRELDYCKSGMNVWGRDFDLQQIQYAIRHQVKEYFPLNGVPQHIVDSLDVLQERIAIAEETVSITVNRIIAEIEREIVQ